MQFIHIGPTYQTHSNINHNNFYNAATIPQQQPSFHFDPTLPGPTPVPSRPRRKVTMLIDDCTLHYTVDTETSERIIDYVSPDGSVIMTQIVNAQVWALSELPYARRRALK
jgi:hypothetical protein